MMMSPQEIVLSVSANVVSNIFQFAVGYVGHVVASNRDYVKIIDQFKSDYHMLHSHYLLCILGMEIWDHRDPLRMNNVRYINAYQQLENDFRIKLKLTTNGMFRVCTFVCCLNASSSFYFRNQSWLAMLLGIIMICIKVLDYCLLSMHHQFRIDTSLLLYNGINEIDDDKTVVSVYVENNNSDTSSMSNYSLDVDLDDLTFQHRHIERRSTVIFGNDYSPLQGGENTLTENINDMHTIADQDLGGFDDNHSLSSLSDLGNAEGSLTNSVWDDFSEDGEEPTFQLDQSGLQIRGLSDDECYRVHVYWMSHYVFPEFIFALDMMDMLSNQNASDEVVNTEGLTFQGDKIDIDINQKNVRRKHFRDKKEAKNNKDIENAKAALRFLKQAKASNAQKHKVITAIETTKKDDPKMHKQLMAEVRGMKFHGSFKDSLAGMYLKSEASSLLGLTYQESFQKYIESLSLLVLNACQCTTWSHFLTTLLAYISARVDKTLYRIIYEYITDLFKEEEKDVTFQSSFIDRLKDVSSILSTGLNSNFCSKLFSFMGLLTTVSLTSYLELPFGMDKYGKYISSAIKEITVKGDIMQQLIEHTIYFWNKGLAFFKTKDLNMIFYDIDDANAYQLEYSDLKGYEYLLDAASLEQFGISVASFSERIELLLLKTDSMLKGCKDDRTRSFIGGKKQSLLILKYKLMVAFRKMTMRVKPYTILLAGESGVGKTVVKDLLIQAITNANPDFFTVGDTKVSSMNDDDQYMTEVDSSTQWLVCDDVANTQPLFAEKPITKTVIHCSNNEPKAIIKAKVEEKGAHYMNFNGIVMTTNKPDLHTKIYTVDPTSVLRRFEVHIEVFIKEEHRQAGSYMLDVNNIDGMHMDVWEFTVARVQKSIEGGKPKYIVLKNDEGIALERVDLDTLLKYLSSNSKKHFNRQKSLLNDHAEIKAMKSCAHGSLIGVCKHVDCGVNFQSSKILIAGATMYISSSILAKLFHFTNWLLMFCLQCKWTQRFISKGMSWKRYIIYLWIVSTCSAFAVPVWTGSIGLFSVFYGVFSTMSMAITGGLYTLSKIARDDINDISMTTWFKANKFYSSNKKLTNALLGMGVLMSIYEITRIVRNATETQFQGSTISNLIHPKEDEIPRKNPYLVPVVQDVDVDHRCRTMTLDQAMTVVKRNQAIVEGPEIRAGIFPICQNMFIVNRHALGSGEGTLKVYRDGVQSLGRNFEAKYSHNTWKRINNGDLCVIYLPNGGSQKDLRHMLPKEHTRGNKGCVMSVKNIDGSYSVSRFYAYYKVLKTSNKELDYEINTPALEYQSDIPLEDGMCMSPLISTGVAPFIIGFHCMGKTGGARGIANQLTYEDVQGAINEMELDDESIVFQTNSYTTVIREEPETGLIIDSLINRKSAVNFLEKGSCQVLGTLNRVMTKSKTKVKDTFISPDIEELLGVPNEYCGPRLLNSWQPKYEELNAIANTADVNPRILNMAYNDMRDHFTEILENIPNWKDKIHPISNEANLAGCDGVYGVNCINLNTSTGFPLYTKKSKIIVHDPNIEVDGISRPLVMEQKHWDEVDRAEEVLASGDRINFIHTACTKDEPKKKGSDKVRVFYVTPLTCLLLCRRYFLMVAKLLMDYSHLFENTIGINVHGKQWGEMAKELLKFGFDRFVNGDFKKYDSKMPAIINLATFKFLIEWCFKSGNYDERSIKIMRGLATELCLPIINFFLTVLIVFGSTISGHSLTICLNSLDNSLIMRYAFYKIFEDKYLGMFNRYVILYTNGDDNIMSVSKEIDGYNHTTIQAALAEDGIVYTMADKEAESVPFLPFSETSYLKRTFRYSDRYKAWMCPIEERSIYKSLHNYIPSKVQSKREHAVEVMNNALREYFYYGESRFNDVRDKLTVVVQRHKLECELDSGSLLTYRQVEEVFVTNQM